MVTWRTDRETVFLYLLFFLFLWDLAYFLGFRNPDRVPHPFVYFRMLGDVEFLRGFGRVMLRPTILSSAAGGVVGVGIGVLVLRSTRLTQAVLIFLRHGLWLPFFVLFATPDAFTLSIAAVALLTCYHYLAAVSFLGLSGREARTYVAREAILQAFLFCLLSQIWWRGGWQWFEFAPMYQPATGAGVLLTVLVFLFFINWTFHFDFDLAAGRLRTILDKNRDTATWKSFCGFLLFAVILLMIWQVIGLSRFPFFSSPLGMVKAGYHLLSYRDIYQDLGVSLLELFGGIILGAAIALLLLALVPSTDGIIRSALFSIFPLLYISPIVLWLFLWTFAGWIRPAQFVEYWHKVIAVSFLSLFTLAQALWALRDRPLVLRFLLAVYESLPIAFVGMLFGQLWAATAGLGFAMIVASATYETDKGLAVFLITVAVLAVLSATLKWIAKRLETMAQWPKDSMN